MRLGVTETIDCAHILPGHPKCGQLHGHTYTVEVEVEGDTSGGMVLDFADLRGQIRSVLGRYDHRHWNDFLDYPTVENICARIAGELAGKLTFPFKVKVFEGRGKWAETSATPTEDAPAGTRR
jgi:6-pyruvoyltetrahydropterin/6-carboxytetrahydropterin synthase